MVVGEFDGGKINSDSGGLLLREVEQRTHILKRLAGCLEDHRNPDQVEHCIELLIKQPYSVVRIRFTILLPAVPSP